MLTSLYHNMSSLILMFLFLTYLWSATIFRYEASIDSIEQLWVNHQSINQRNFIEKTKADINSNDALTKNQNCSIYLFPAWIDRSEGRGQPLGSYFSTSFCHPYLLSSLGETSCFVVVVVVVLLRLYNNEPGKNLKTYNILTPWLYSISVTYVLLQSWDYTQMVIWIKTTWQNGVHLTPRATGTSTGRGPKHEIVLLLNFLTTYIILCF